MTEICPECEENVRNSAPFLNRRRFHHQRIEGNDRVGRTIATRDVNIVMEGWLSLLMGTIPTSEDQRP